MNNKADIKKLVNTLITINMVINKKIWIKL